MLENDLFLYYNELYRSSLVFRIKQVLVQILDRYLYKWPMRIIKYSATIQNLYVILNYILNVFFLHKKHVNQIFIVFFFLFVTGKNGFLPISNT